MTPTIAQLKSACRQYGIAVSGNKSTLWDRLEEKLVVVEKGDLRVTRRLGAAYLRTCEVPRGCWRHSRKWGWSPTAWMVPAVVVAFGVPTTPPPTPRPRHARLSDYDSDPTVYRYGL